jgi:hypothetical protein
MVGPDVKALQEALNAWGATPKLVTDGKFGHNTDAAVKAFQKKQKLKDDGVVGRRTRAALFPFGVATVTISGMKLQMPPFPGRPKNTPRILPGTLTLNPTQDWNELLCRKLDIYHPIRLPGLWVPVAVPQVPEWNFTVPPSPSRPAEAPLGFVDDHLELQPGAQSTFPIGGRRQDMFILTMQSVFRRGPDDGSHLEADLGMQIGDPVSAPNSPWTFNPFVQLTDVDRFGSLGWFHYWQPYAQIGAQFSGPGNPQPSITGNLFPVNLGVDLGDNLTVSLGGGPAFTWNLNSGQVQTGLQVSGGISLKLGRPTAKPNSSP